MARRRDRRVPTAELATDGDDHREWVDGLQSSESGLANLVLQTATSELLNLTLAMKALGVIITIFGMVRVGMEDDASSSADSGEKAMASRT